MGRALLENTALGATAVTAPVRVGKCRVGAGRPCFIIAEAGVNHNGRLDLGRRLVEAAARAGADAVKFQTFRATALASPGAPTARYQRTGRIAGLHQREMLRALELSRAAHRALMEHSRERGVLFLSTPFDEESSDFLEDLGVPAFKTSSGDLTNLPFLAHLAQKKRPLLISTGMATLAEVGRAVDTIRRSGNPPLVLLHCVSAYPTAIKDVNLRAMATLGRAFGVSTGFSDHTPGLSVPLAAAALGAAVIEKHMTLDRSLPGPDHRMSLLPGEMASLVKGVREVESALGTGVKRPVAAEKEIARVARKSLVAARTLRPGETLDRSSIAILRPGTGLPPSALPAVVGRRARKTIPAGALLQRGWLQ